MSPVTQRQTTKTNFKMAAFIFEERIFEELLVNPGYFGILYRILGYLDFQTLLRCQQVSKSFKRSILSSQRFWTLQKRFFDTQLEFFQVFEQIDFDDALGASAKGSIIKTLNSSNTLHQAIKRWLKCNEQVLPKYWEARTTPDGQLYYINRKTRSAQWLHPLPVQVRLPLPPDWEIWQTEQKYFLFVNMKKRLCSWKHPSQIKQNEHAEQLVNYVTDNGTAARNILEDHAPRLVELVKGHSKFGLKIMGGNEDVKGIFISFILPGSPADTCGALNCGDQILTINDIDIRAASHAEAVACLSGQCLRLLVQYRPEEYNRYEQLGATAEGTLCFYKWSGKESVIDVLKWYHPGLIKAMQASLPDDWEVKLDSHGLIFYVNHTDRYSTRYHPSENPKLGHLQSSKLRIRPFFKSKTRSDRWSMDEQDQNFDLTLFYLKTFGIVICGITAVAQICYDLLHM